MTPPLPLTVNVGGRLLDLSRVRVMAVVNLTDDSFYAASRVSCADALRRRLRQAREEGADIVDLGACSTRPGSRPVGAADETERLLAALAVVREEWPGAVVSVDTFRAGVAEACYRQHGPLIVNDISAGTLDTGMFATVARLGLPYVLTHIQGRPETMQLAPRYGDTTADVLRFLAGRVRVLRELGQKDIIVDPGFGFGKSLADNYRLVRDIAALRELGLPILIGLSRKSMVSRALGITAEGALNGTTALHALILAAGGANILRVHDVAEARQTVRLAALALDPAAAAATETN